MSLSNLAMKIRRRETPFYDRVYRIGKYLRNINMPVFRPLYVLFYYERETRLNVFHFLSSFFYYEPMFKTRCHRVGEALNLVGGIPQVLGPLTLNIGNNVTIHGVSTFIGAKVFENPTLSIGNNTHLGYQVGITIGCDIKIGNNVLIANGVNIFSYDQHSTNPTLRHLPAPPETGKPVVIEDNVWIGTKSVISKGVTIGKNSVVAAGSVVIQKIPADSLAIGNPARVYPLVY
jgi:acetyltransferase-like isoleucine patch superfamily enzyme